MKVLMFSVLILAVCFVLVQTAIVPHSNCGSYWKVFNVTVTECAALEINRCILRPGDNITLSFEFNSGLIDIDDDLFNEISIIIRGHWFEEPVDPPHPCDVLKCPIAQNYVEHYSVKMHIPNTYSVALANIEWKTFTRRLEQLLCFQIPISILA